jgi:signal transduction histidine kinase/streptogramin lyase
LFELDLETETLRRAAPDDPAWPDLGAPQVEAMLTDLDGGLWIGTWGGGLRRLSPMALLLAKARRADLIPEAIEGADVTAVRADRRGGTWFGTANGILARVDTSGSLDRRQTTRAAGVAPTILDVTEDSAGRIWYGADQDLVRLDPATGQAATFRHDPADPASLGAGFVRVVTTDTLGRLWVGTGEGGVQRLDPAGRVVERHRHDPADPHSLSDDYVTAIYEDTDGRLWVGTRSGGLNILDPASGRAERYAPDPLDPESLGHHYVTAIHKDRRGRIWIATSGGGFALARPAGAGGRLRFERFTEENGLVDNDVMAILEDDDGSLWLPTRRGLARFDPDGARFVSLLASDGLPSAEFEPGCATRAGDVLYFGTIKGPIALRAGTTFPQVRPSPTVVTSIRTPTGEVRTDRPVWSLDRLSVPYGGWLTIDLAVLDYAPRQRHRYAYRLGGDWIDLGPTRQITFTQLKPGRYRFSARGRNAAGEWSAPTSDLAIDVVPPFWMTGWFRGLLVAGLAAAAVVVHRVRLSAVERRNRELEALYEQREHARRDLADAYERLSLLTRRLEAAKEDERQRIARELHDDMGPSLTAVIINLQLLARGAATGLATRIHDTIGIVDRLVQRVRDLSLDLRPPLLDELGLGVALRGYLETQTSRSGQDIAVDIGPDLENLPPGVQVHCFRVVQEAVTNAIRHASARRITVTAGRDGEDVVLSVRDDGRGFDVQRALATLSGRSVGLLGMLERVKSLGGALVIESAPGKGTEVNARIPAAGA